jgi:hypothetical protein
MKSKIYRSLSFLFLLILLHGTAKAQEDNQKTLRIKIEENGVMVKDTVIKVEKNLPEKDLQAIISEITGEDPLPCPAGESVMHDHQIRYVDCHHAEQGELDSLLAAGGVKTVKSIHTDTCIHKTDNQEIAFVWTDSGGSTGNTACHKEKEIIIMHKGEGGEPLVIKEEGDVIIIREDGGEGKKCINVISDTEGDGKPGGSQKEVKVIYMEGDSLFGKSPCAEEAHPGSHHGGKDPVVVTDKGDIIIIKSGTDEHGYRYETHAGADSPGSEKTITVVIEDEGSKSTDLKETKVVEKKIIITDETDKAEKATVVVSPEKAEKSKKKSK